MRFHVLTLFPEMMLGGLNTSIIGRAAEKNIICINAVNIRDYTLDRHGRTDDYPYGGGAGMLMQAQPVFDAYRAVCGNTQEEKPGRKRLRTVYMTPQGVPFTQRLAQELSKEEELVFLCGHYEGIDERVLEEIVTDYVSVGDYVLTGGELPAMVMIDAIARLVPGVLHNDFSAQTESFHNDLLEYPQYTRPEEWRGRRVPGVLLSGDHKKITAWRLEQAVERTRDRRRDLYEKYQEKQRLIHRLSRKKRKNIHMIESLSRGKGEILYAKNGNVLIYDRSCRCCMASAENRESAGELLCQIPEETKRIIASQEFLKEILCGELPFSVLEECIQVCYPQKQKLSVKHKDIRLLEEKDTEYVLAHCVPGRGKRAEAAVRSETLYGAFAENRPVGFMSLQQDGGMGFLFVEETFRGQGIALSLEAYCINRMLERDWTPYGHVPVENEAGACLQRKLGLYEAEDRVWKLERTDAVNAT